MNKISQHKYDHFPYIPCYYNHGESMYPIISKKYSLDSLEDHATKWLYRGYIVWLWLYRSEFVIVHPCSLNGISLGIRNKKSSPKVIITLCKC